jgi:hypothetical protein
MMRKIVMTIMLMLSLLVFPQDTVLVVDLFGLRPVKGISIEEMSWLRTDFFKGMSRFGDTLFVSKKFLAETDPLDAKAGENNLLRRKFFETRQVMLSEFFDEKKMKEIVLEGELNRQVNSGGLMLSQNSLSGLIPSLNYKGDRGKLYRVEVEKNRLRTISPWEGNSKIDFALNPVGFNRERDVVFVADNGENSDLFFWSAATGQVVPFAFNSQADEINPYIFNDSLLFFSSDRAEKGSFDIYYHNLRKNEEPKLLLPEELKSVHNELAIDFINDSVAVMVRKFGSLYTYNKVTFHLGFAPNSYLPLPEHLLGEPADMNGKIVREHGRRSIDRFLKTYGLEITVRRPEDIFTDSLPLNPYAVRTIESVLRRDNLLDVSFFLPSKIEEEEFSSPTYSVETTTTSGIVKIAQLARQIKDVHVLIIGISPGNDGSDLNMIRSYYQAMSVKMQLNEVHGVPESQIHILAAGDYVDKISSGLYEKIDNGIGAVYLYRNRSVPPLLAAYKLTTIENNEVVAGRYGIPLSALTYSNLSLKPFIQIPTDLLFLPVKEVTMLWKGDDLTKVAEQHNISLNHLLRVNGLSDPIIQKQSLIYVP